MSLSLLSSPSPTIRTSRAGLAPFTAPSAPAPAFSLTPPAALKSLKTAAAAPLAGASGPAGPAGLAGPSSAPGPVDPQEAAVRAKITASASSFESQFLSVMIGQMFEGVETQAPFGGGAGEKAFKSFLTDAFARSIADHGGIGLAAPVSRSMLKLQGLAA